METQPPAIRYPALILDETICRRNIRRMAQKAENLRISFRPHFKTHQSAAVGEWFREAGIRAITVSSPGMALYFARHGWHDITLAFPLNPRWVPEINLMPEGVALNLVTDHPSVAGQALPGLNRRHRVFVKVDNGYGRAGIPANDIAMLQLLGKAITRAGHDFAGILIHQGDNYHHFGPATLLRAHDRNMANLVPMVEWMQRHAPGTVCSWGDTPSCTLAESFPGIGEFRPGNFVFYDLMQVTAGVCTPGDVAVTLAATVASVHPGRGRMILHAGAVHLSKEHLSGPDGRASFGQITTMEGTRRGGPIPGLELTDLSQEHGLVEGSPERIRAFTPGDILGIVPVHSCLAADLMKGYVTITGEYLDTIHSARPTP